MTTNPESLSPDERDFLERLRDDRPLGLADRAADKVRQRMRRLGYAKVVMHPRRWVLLHKGLDALAPTQPSPSESLLAVTQEDETEASRYVKKPTGFIDAEHPDRCSFDHVSLSRAFARYRLASRPAPPAQPGREEVVSALIGALKEARAALHQHYVDWDGEPEDAVPLQLARATCDAALSAAEPQDWPKELDTSASMPVDFERRYEVEPAQDVRPEAEPIAWMIRETRAGKKRTMCGKVYMQEEPARAAARLLSNLWRSCTAFPVYAHPPTLPTEPASVRENVEREIVAWLRDQSADKQDREWMGPLDIADAIERGEHRAALSTEEPANG